MTRDELISILEKHKKWRNEEEGGERADLCGADLREANLRGANLCGANLWGANTADLITVGPVGSRRGITIYNIAADEVRCGCYGGSLAQFGDRVEQAHAGNPVYLAEYRAAIEFFKAIRAARKEGEHEAGDSIGIDGGAGSV